MTEPEAGSDVLSLSTTAIPNGGDYILNGKKCMISLAPVADIYLVFATTNPCAGRWGVSAFLIERHTPGFEVQDTTRKMGLDSVPMASIELHDCRVSQAQRLGAESAGAVIANSACTWMQCELALAVNHKKSTNDIIINRCIVSAEQLNMIQRKRVNHG